MRWHLRNRVPVLFTFVSLNRSAPVGSARCNGYTLTIFSPSQSTSPSQFPPGSRSMSCWSSRKVMLGGAFLSVSFISFSLSMLIISAASFLPCSASSIVRVKSSLYLLFKVSLKSLVSVSSSSSSSVRRDSSAPKNCVSRLDSLDWVVSFVSVDFKINN